MCPSSKLPAHGTGNTGPGARADVGEGGRLRDADWARAWGAGIAQEGQAATQLLHRWSVAEGASAAGLSFHPLDGNPRHGVLVLHGVSDQGPCSAIEILERQGRWLIMPDRARANQVLRLLAQEPGAHTTRSAIAGTPDRRFVFFNSLQEGRLVTRIERRRDEGLTFS